MAAAKPSDTSRLDEWKTTESELAFVAQANSTGFLIHKAQVTLKEFEPSFGDSGWIELQNLLGEEVSFELVIESVEVAAGIAN